MIKKLLMPALLVALVALLGCDNRSVSSTSGSGTTAEVGSIELSLDNTLHFYSQSAIGDVVDTLSVVVLDAQHSSIAEVQVNCTVSPVGYLTPINSGITDETGTAYFRYAINPNSATLDGDYIVNFSAQAGNRTRGLAMNLYEQSNVELEFRTPEQSDLIYRMEDGQTLPVEVLASRVIDNDGQEERVGVEGVRINLRATGITTSLPGSITSQGVTDEDGIARVFYFNGSEQPADTVSVRLSARIGGWDVATPEAQTSITVNVMNDYGNTLTRTLPQQLNLQSDILCSDSTRFVWLFRDSQGDALVSKRFDFSVSMGELDQYLAVTDDNGQLSFTWRSCENTSGNLILTMEGPHRTYTYSYPVAAPRGIGLSVLSPVNGSLLEIDSECSDDNLLPVRVLMKYTDDNSPIPNRTVNFAATFGQIGGSALTDASGVATVDWQDCDESDRDSTLVLTANYMGDATSPLLSTNASYQLTLPLGVPNRITLAAARDTLPEYEESGVIDNTDIVATVYNSQNQTLGAGLVIGFKTNGIGTISNLAYTDSEGRATANFSMNELTGVSAIRAFYEKPGTTPAETLWSQPTTVSVESGLPANVTLDTGTPRIQIRGFGANSVAQVRGRVVDGSGATVTLNTDTYFKILSAPDSVYLSLPGQSERVYAGDSILTQTANGVASVTVNAGKRPGTVNIQCRVIGDGYSVSSASPLVTVVAGPPAYGTMDYDGVGEAIGGGMWRVTWSVHLWDRYSNDVRDSSAVYFYLFPEDVCSMDGFGQTGIGLDGGEGQHGIAYDYMQYGCNTIGDTLVACVAQSAGEVEVIEYEEVGWPPELVPVDTTWEAGYVYVAYPEDNNPWPMDPPATTFQVPFQAGDRDDNLQIFGQFQQVQFNMEPCNQSPTQEMQLTVVLIDGYSCRVANQLIQVWIDFPHSLVDEFDDPTDGIVMTDDNGTATLTANLESSALQNLQQQCIGDDGNPMPGCFAYGTLTVNYGAFRLPDGNPQSNDASVSLSRPCQ